MADRNLFVNLPVADLAASAGFFRALGFEFDERFTDETATCMLVGEQAFVMLLTRERFGDFVTRPVADPSATAQAILAFSVDSRAEVDRIADAALAAGAAPGKEPEDHGFMYSRGFHDLDGHMWGVLWMSPEAVEQGPQDVERDA